MTGPAEGIPFLAGKEHVSAYADCQEIFVSPRLFEVDPLEQFSAPLWHDTLAIINGDTHLARRRYLAPLFSRGAVTTYERDILRQAIGQSLNEARSEASSGDDVELDLIWLAKRMLVRIAATYIGLDGVLEDRDRADELLRVVSVWTTGTQARYSTRPPDEVVAEGLVALQEYTTEFYEPSRSRREALVARHLAGELTRDELPFDVITFQLLPEGTEIWNRETALLDTLPMLAGGLHTTALSTARTIDEYLKWRAEHRDMVVDRVLLRGMINESLRLYPPVAFIVRKAVDDVTLASGLQIEDGSEIALCIGDANRDPDVFGSDADEFQPDRFRKLPANVPPFGLSFGAGPHLCIGRPLVTETGSEHIDPREQRIMVTLVESFLAHDVRQAGGEPLKEASYRDMFNTYPVRLTIPEQAA